VRGEEKTAQCSGGPGYNTYIIVNYPTNVKKKLCDVKKREKGDPRHA
jgi:hypothetical protein